MIPGKLCNLIDDDPTETAEWRDALDAVILHVGTDRARYLIEQLAAFARLRDCRANVVNMPYCNTLSADLDAQYPGDLKVEKKIRAILRWNAMACILRAASIDKSLGGHLGSFASSALLYDVGFNHFWHAPTKTHGGDLIYYQGHISPGIYARSFMEGRISEKQMINFRQEAFADGLSSYPHPWLMPDYWQFPTVSMGLGPIQAIYQARFLRYLQARGFADTSSRKVWCFCGDGEMDEPESVGALAIAAREKLNNLVFVINCNLQRLDGPVRGNGKIIQELESVFHGAGWNVIKVIWGSGWDKLLAKDKTGLLQLRMQEVLDGDYQYFNAHGASALREKFFGKYPELLELVANYSDSDLAKLTYGGHDPQKIYSAYKAASEYQDGPTVILAKTIKGYGLGAAEGQNIAHNSKKMSSDEVRIFRDRFAVPVTDAELAKLPFVSLQQDSHEYKYLHAARKKLGGYLPQRRSKATLKLKVPSLDTYAAILAGSGDREISTTMAFVRIVTTLCKDKDIGKHIVPIVPDEARTFGMEGLFRQFGIYAFAGQKYKPADASQVMFYKEAADGQILQEGLNEAGAFCSWFAASTSYSVNDVTMIPFYIYYSMFGFQRIGDLAWAAGDAKARGFLIGATSGRTTLNGEGLQHEDGHSHVIANTIPNCVCYDPAFSYELAVIINSGLRRMVTEEEDVFFYITVMNENYQHPAMPEGAEIGIERGMYLLQAANLKSKARVQLLGSGTILREVISAANILESEYNVAADIWSVTSFTELARQGRKLARKQIFADKVIEPYVTKCLAKTKAPVIAATDYMKQHADQIREFVPHDYTVLGTDGFGRSDTRANLRDFFEVDAKHIVITALKSLVKLGKIEQEVLAAARSKYKINAQKADPSIS